MKPDTRPDQSLCAVVPAAGRGSRLGMDIPKVFVPLLPSLTIWDAIQGKLGQVADRTILILSPEGKLFLEDHRASFESECFRKTEVVCQNEPLGMGDAIFTAADLWRDAKDLLIVWGDQFNLSIETLRACSALHSSQTVPSLTLPLVRVAKPYVEYVFDSLGRLIDVRQSREGEACESGGCADMGVFLLSGGAPLIEEWRKYQRLCARGPTTGEINFLPFLVHLSMHAGWPVQRHEASDPEEAMGINTLEDLAQARRILAAKPTGQEKRR